ncbi:MAG: crossover junction endodeoxyribonuclease RuvC [Deltaproteobacteria bacterium]|nr:crossover junction endodeoxyribonuclease RuvC [Deltaproteobacteria bacterium]
MRILGIDPGSQITGYGIIEGYGSRCRHIDNGVIRPKTTATYSARLHHIYHQLLEVIATYQPNEVAIESLFYAKNPKSTLQLGQARGVAILAVTEAGLPLHEYSTRLVKQSVVGHGNATKAQVQYMTAKLLQLPAVAAEDAADALAVALLHAQQHRFCDH